jgi:hypothetical protein
MAWREITAWTIGLVVATAITVLMTVYLVTGIVDP